MPTSDDRSQPRTEDEALAVVLARAGALHRRRLVTAGAAIVVVLMVAVSAIAAGIGRSPEQQLVAGPDEREPTSTTTTTAPLAAESTTSTTTAAPTSASSTSPPTTAARSTPTTSPTVDGQRYPADGGPARPPLRMTLLLESNSVEAGATLRGELVVENTGDTPYRYETGGCGGTDGFFRQGVRQGGERNVCTADIRTEELAPGEVRRVTIEVVASRDSTPSTACGGCLAPNGYLPPGTYDVLASRTTDGYESYAPPVVVTVT